MLANALCSLIVEERISTTVTRAKEIRRLAEKMITLGKNGTLHARRQAIAALRQPVVVAQLFGEIAPRFEGRNGGYTRIMRTGNRAGDAAEMCLLEWVTESPTPPAETAEAPKEVSADSKPAATGTDENVADEKAE